MGTINEQTIPRFVEFVSNRLDIVTKLYIVLLYGIRGLQNRSNLEHCTYFSCLLNKATFIDPIPDGSKLCQYEFLDVITVFR